MIKKTYWPNGKQKFELHIDDKINEVTKAWYESGQMRYVTPYHMGKMHGLYRSWNEDGTLRHESYYLYGREVTKKQWRAFKLTEALAGI